MRFVPAEWPGWVPRDGFEAWCHARRELAEVNPDTVIGDTMQVSVDDVAEEARVWRLMYGPGVPRGDRPWWQDWRPDGSVDPVDAGP